MAKVEDLIALCDESEMFIQNLDENIVEGKIKNKNGYFTFLTDPQFVKAHALGKPEKVGIVIWFPVNVFDRKPKEKNS